MARPRRGVSPQGTREGRLGRAVRHSDDLRDQGDVCHADELWVLTAVEVCELVGVEAQRMQGRRGQGLDMERRVHSIEPRSSDVPTLWPQLIPLPTIHIVLTVIVWWSRLFVADLSSNVSQWLDPSSMNRKTRS